MKISSLALLFFLISLPHVSAAMRCGQRLVEIGEHKIDVLKKCGPPTLAERRTGIVGETFHHPRRTLDLQKYEEVIIDEWVYNFGPRKFMQYLRFENNILMEVDDLGYGY